MATTPFERALDRLEKREVDDLQASLRILGGHSECPANARTHLEAANAHVALALQQIGQAKAAAAQHGK